jgi:hypothetical protein
MTKTKYDELLEQAERGDVQSQYEVGMAIAYFKGVFSDARGKFKHDPHYGIEFLQKAAAKNYPPALCEMGIQYFRGDWVNQDYVKYCQYSLKAALAGYAMGANNIGWAYYTGQGVPKDWQKAFSWTKKAAEQDCPYAYETMAIMYWNGEGTDPDFNQALYWLQKASEKEAKGNKGTLEVLTQIKAAGTNKIVGKLVLEDEVLAWTERKKKAAKRQDLGMVLRMVTGKELPVSGGYGTSVEDAIVIECGSESDGVALERLILSILFNNPKPKIVMQALQKHEGHMYDVVKVDTGDKEQSVFFNIDAYYGRFW